MSESAALPPSLLAGVRQASRASGAWCIVETPAGRVVHVDEELVGILGLPGAEEVTGLESVVLLEGASRLRDPDTAICVHEEILVDREPTCRGRLVPLRDGRVLERRFARLVFDGIDHGHVWTWRDVSEREHLRARVAAVSDDQQALAESDPLTRLRTRRGFLALARQALAGARAVGHASALVVLDLEGLEVINVAHGRRAGDRVIARFAELLLSSYRVTDVVGRLEGRRFAVLAARCGQTQAEASLVRLARRVADPVEGCAGVRVRAVVCLEDGEEALEALVDRAERTLARAADEDVDGSILVGDSTVRDEASADDGSAAA